MTLTTVLILAAALWGIGLYGAISQQSFVMLMMGLELTIGAVFVAAAGVWHFAGVDAAKGQLLVIIAMAVMAVEMAIGFAIVVNLARARGTETTEGLEDLRR